MQLFFIWSHERNKWWLPNEQGYTENLCEAGTYLTAKANSVCAHSNRDKLRNTLINVSMLENIRSDTKRKPTDFDQYRNHNVKIKKNGEGMFMRLEEQTIQMHEATAFLDILLETDIDPSKKYIVQQAKDKLTEKKFEFKAVG